MFKHSLLIRKSLEQFNTSSNVVPSDSILSIAMNACSAATFRGRTFESLAHATVAPTRVTM
jgi:hypothetical protein